MDILVRGTYQEASHVELPPRGTRPLPLRPRPRVRARPAPRRPRRRADAAALVPAARPQAARSRAPSWSCWWRTCRHTRSCGGTCCTDRRTSATTCGCCSDAHVEIWLICWCPTQETGFHDHGGSRGAVAVLQGMLSETLPNIGGEHPRALYRTWRLLLVRRVAHPRRPARRRRSGRVAARVLAAPGRDGLLRAGRRRHADAAAGRQRRRVLLTVRSRPAPGPSALHLVRPPWGTRLLARPQAVPRKP